MLGAFQCHVFLDWRFVHGNQWKTVYEALNGAGMPSVQARFDELFVVKEEVKIEPVKAKRKRVTKPRVTKKPTGESAAKKPVKSKKGQAASKKKP
jgi:hypothetical protein